jgi:hypothetical protein
MYKCNAAAMPVRRISRITSNPEPLREGIRKSITNLMSERRSKIRRRDIVVSPFFCGTVN